MNLIEKLFTALPRVKYICILPTGGSCGGNCRHSVDKAVPARTEEWNLFCGPALMAANNKIAKTLLPLSFLLLALKLATLPQEMHHWQFYRLTRLQMN